MEDIESFLIHKTELIKAALFLVTGVHAELTESYFKNTLGFIRKALHKCKLLLLLLLLHICMAINHHLLFLHHPSFHISLCLAQLHCFTVGKHVLRMVWSCRQFYTKTRRSDFILDIFLLPIQNKLYSSLLSLLLAQTAFTMYTSEEKLVSCLW